MVFGLVKQGLDPWLRESPTARIQRLFLTPDNVLCVGVHVEIFLELGPWEGVELLDARDGGVFELFGGAVFVQSCIDLACAEDDTLDFFGWGDRFAMFGVRDDPLKAGFASEV